MLFLLLSSFDVRMAASDIISSPGNQISVNCCHGNLLIFYLNYPSPSWLEIKLAGEEAMKNARRPPNVINNSIKTETLLDQFYRVLSPGPTARSRGCSAGSR